ncbi:hypothetical protein [Vibrio furnissii]|uniref:Uncharacterized protein n=1 Tax=Vibrio furnissii TaxID=29494 RepID=A0A0Q2QZ90_VIBFU|nr:hypothetical protein [Vibrio furnissii]ADT85448.1 hypothetical protein vfu_A00217 [Vibrio furnissii NCTC 11218]EEX39479.1 putative membrane protein [Vibrio furnissii CIP 102972]KQH85245.1 hypothetical protein AMR76_14180 [Vibrio furnissii]MCG6216753.1 hypothetical protein [Vibrio furnissii]MCG6227149.1 hypothetical protein [Vibrio furnissii]
MRLESIHQDVISFERFIGRCIRYALIALGVLLLGLLPGVLGFLLLAELTAVQAWLNALSMVSGLALPYPVADFHQSASLHLFLAFYSLFIETVFFVALATLFAPIIHRVFHRMHCAEEA